MLGLKAIRKFFTPGALIQQEFPPLPALPIPQVSVEPEPSEVLNYQLETLLKLALEHGKRLQSVETQLTEMQNNLHQGATILKAHQTIVEEHQKKLENHEDNLIQLVEGLTAVLPQTLDMFRTYRAP